MSFLPTEKDLLEMKPFRRQNWKSLQWISYHKDKNLLRVIFGNVHGKFYMLHRKIVNVPCSSQSFMLTKIYRQMLKYRKSVRQLIKTCKWTNGVFRLMLGPQLAHFHLCCYVLPVVETGAVRLLFDSGNAVVLRQGLEKGNHLWGF